MCCDSSALRQLFSDKLFENATSDVMSGTPFVRVNNSSDSSPVIAVMKPELGFIFLSLYELCR